MRTVVIGVGHVGLVTAATLAEWGHDVVGVDDDHARIDGLNEGRSPFFEPGLDELVARWTERGTLRFSKDLAASIDGAEVVFVCVGTPSLPGGAPNLSFVERVGREVAHAATGPLVLVEKSTVPAQTGVRLQQVVARELDRAGRSHDIQVASNPEFLREGNAVEDTLHPDRVVIGAATEAVRKQVRAVYEPMVQVDGCPVIETDLQTAELIKHASNAFLATKISFINAVARICDAVGADVETVAAGMGHDHRIGPHFLYAGLGYGGSCFPKDVDAFIHLASSVGYDFGLLEEVRRINEGQRDWVVDKLRQELWHVEGKTVALLGGSFKPGTDDLRSAPGLAIAEQLVADGATVRVYDPVALPKIEAQYPDLVTVDDPIAACEGAHAAIVCTEWPQIVELEPAAIASALAYPILIDGRNVFDPNEARAAGLTYHDVGRSG